VARLIDSYADGLLDKHEFEPRIVRLRQRIAHLEAQRQQLADDATLHTELQLIIGRLEDFATKVHDRLGEADWTSQRDLIRTLVRRVEVARDQVNIVFRVDPHPEESDPEKKSLQLCRGSGHASLWRSVFCWPKYVPVYHPRFEPLLDRSSEVWACVHLFQEGRLINAVKAACDICIEHVSGLYLYGFPYLLHRILA